jgi:trimeric autotransporter adhesin
LAAVETHSLVRTGKRAVLVAAAMVLAAACGDPEEGTLQGLDVRPPEAQTNPGQVVAFVGLGDYPEGKGPSNSPPIAWRSSDPAVATIDGQGRATAVAPGMVTITATAEGFTATARLVVTPPRKLTGLTVTPATGQVPVQRTLALTATGSYNDGTTARLTDMATWTSSNPAIAIVTNEGVRGLAMGRSEGMVEITATVGMGADAMTAKAQITVTPVGSPDP